MNINKHNNIEKYPRSAKVSQIAQKRAYKLSDLVANFNTLKSLRVLKAVTTPRPPP